MREAWLRHAARDLPRYTSYPTAVRFHDGVGPADALRWAAAVPAAEPISVYVHVPFCEQLCWYCGCHTTVPNGYDRVEALARRLQKEALRWAGVLGEHAGAAHVHFGGGSPNALSPADFVALSAVLARAFAIRSDAEIAVELDPRSHTPAFADAAARVGVTRASLGVQTFDPAVQAKVNRVQPLDMVVRAVEDLRQAGVRSVNFDLMYGLPGQSPESVAETARLAADLRPDRLAVFGYAHVPWFKKHQRMIREEELAGLEGRWAQADAADAVLVEAGYVRIGLDHYARPDDPLALAAAAGRLRRNFQGYTVDPATTLVPLGPSAIGAFQQGFVQNAKSTSAWGEAVDAGRLAVDRGLERLPEERTRAAVIERLMCDLSVDLDAVCRGERFGPDSLAAAIDAAAALEADGICSVRGRRVSVEPQARRLLRVVAACFDQDLARTQARHAAAV